MPDFTISMGATGSPSKTYGNIAAGSVCTVTETEDGSTSTVGVSVSGSGREFTITPGSPPVTANITDTYSHLPGSLTVNKVIAGPAAGSQGAVTIRAVCGSTALTPDFTIAAGRPAASYSYTWTGIAANSSCVVTETVNGGTSNVSVATVGSPQTVTVGAGQDAQATPITDTYDFLVGSLKVIKTIGAPQRANRARSLLR